MSKGYKFVRFSSKKLPPGVEAIVISEDNLNAARKILNKMDHLPEPKGSNFKDYLTDEGVIRINKDLEIPSDIEIYTFLDGQPPEEAVVISCHQHPEYVYRLERLSEMLELPFDESKIL